MTETEEPQYYTIQERLQALNRSKNFTAPPNSARRPPPPPPTPANRSASRTSGQPTALGSDHSSEITQPKRPTIPPRPNRGAPPQLPPRTTTAKENGGSPVPSSCGLAPPLPDRRDSEVISPALPPRRLSTQSLAVRRNSNESDVSHVSTISALSLNNNALSSTTSAGSTDGFTGGGRKLPPSLDMAKLPPLPPTKRELEVRAQEEAVAARAATTRGTKPPPLLPARSAPVVPRAGPVQPLLPPRLPSRPAARSPQLVEDEEPSSVLPRRLPPPPTKFVRTVPEVSGKTAGGTPSDAPPPVPVASRPSHAQIDELVTRAKNASCLVCRDFSGPDAVAAQQPSSSIPRDDPVGYLAQVLCTPFPSATDKARAIFTWCHHNIRYDVEGFLAGRPVHGTARETIHSGLAVCEGYARVYEAVAKRAGLECILIGGHGKGYGFNVVGKGQRLPARNPSGHAWNAVKIDNGQWKLIDPCWGAGHLGGDNKYHQTFSPLHFTSSNEDFGTKHFPSDNRHFFRDDGRIISWEEYIIGPNSKGEPTQWCGDAVKEGISEQLASPREKQIPVHSGETVRFQFGKLCEHWTSEKNGIGKPRLLMISIHGIGGYDDDLVPLDHDGFWWYIDIPARDLGAPGQTVSLIGLDTLDGKSARGVTKGEFLSKKGRCGMSWAVYTTWELV